MSTHPPVPCPQCGTPVHAGPPACPRCGLRLVGPEAARLWQVTQQIEALRAEADHLVGLLRGPAPQPVAGSAPPTGALSGPPPVPPHPAPPYPAAPYPGRYPAAATAPPPRRGLSGQQVMLGLGALLTLSASSLFLLVVWFVVGLAGQATIMVVLTAGAALAAAESTRRRLPAAAETFAVLTAGLLLIDLTAAHRLDLAGLGSLSPAAYWTGAGLLAGSVLLLADRLVPRSRDGVPLRPVVAHRPAAAAFLAAAGVAAAQWASTGPVAAVAACLVLAVVAAAGLGLAVRLDRPTPPVATPQGPVPGRPGLTLWARPGSSGRAVVVPLSTVPPALVGVGALLAHVLLGLDVGLDPAAGTAARYGVVALLLVLPALAVALRVVRPALGRVAGRQLLLDAAVVAALPALVVVGADTPRWGLVAAAWVVAVALVAELAVRRRAPGTAGTVGWLLLPTLVLATWLLTEAAAADGLALLAELSGSPAPGWLPVLPALAWVAASLGAVVLTRRAAWGLLAQAAVLVTLLLLVRDAEPLVQVVVALVGCVLTAVLSAAAGALPDGSGRELHERGTGAFAAAYGLAALVVSNLESPALNAAALVVTGATLLAVAAGHDRLAPAYPGALLVSAGVWRFLAEVDVEPVEAYTAAPFLLLAGIGALQALRAPGSPTVLTAGPALAVALLPTTWVAITEGDALRLAAVTLLASGVLVAGVARRWRAPVVVGGAVLLLVAVTQGGPLLAHVHGFVTLFVAGALLLAVGVAWERAVLAGRRAAGWFSTLR